MGPFSSSWGCSAYGGAPGSVPCGGVTWLGALDSWTGRRARVRSRLAEAEGTQSWNRMGCSNFFGLVSINCKKTGCPELVKAGYPEQIREIRKRSGKQSNRFRPDSEFDIPYYRTESEFVRKCENERVKWRNRCGTERDLSRPFSTLVSALRRPLAPLAARGCHTITMVPCSRLP